LTRAPGQGVLYHTRAMREELLRILQKDNWTEEDKEDLKVIFDGKLSELIGGIEPDILEMGLKELIYGRGSVVKRLKRASIILQIDQKYLKQVFEVLKDRKPSHKRKEIPFKELLDKAKYIDVFFMEKGFIDDLQAACEISYDFRKELEGLVDPYVYVVATHKRRKPVVIDGSNLLWSAGLCVHSLYLFFDYIAKYRPVLYPFYFVFDKNVRHVLPLSERDKIDNIIMSKNVFLYSPADDLIISIAKEKGAIIFSNDKFRDKNIKGLKVAPFPKEVGGWCE